MYTYSWPLNNQALGAPIPCAVETLRRTFDSPDTELLIAHCGLEALLTHIPYVMCIIHIFLNNVS